MSKGYRDYCFTINHPDEADYDWLTQSVFKYIIAGFEVGESGTPHFQGYCCFKDQKTLSALKKIHPRAHWEKRMGTQQQAIDYCRKDGQVIEYGTPPMSQAQKGEKGKEWWLEQVKCIAEDRHLDMDTECLVKNFAGLHKAASLLYPKKLEHTETQMLWYYGGPGTGKSRTAREAHPGAYLKMCNKWWDGYTGQDCAIIEDVDKNHSVLCHHLKIWGDRYPFPAEIKGGKIDIRPKLLIVTSNHHPDEIFTDEKGFTDNDRAAILRRYKTVHFDCL